MLTLIPIMCAYPKHIVVDISAHGWGHLAQAAQVVNALNTLRPDLRLTIRTPLPKARVQARVQGEVDLQLATLDIGMVMQGALQVDVERSWRAYQGFHAGWEDRIAHASQELATLNPDILLADVPYLSLAAAARIGVPAVALCSLDWATLFWHYCGHYPGAMSIYEEIKAAYRAAQLFIQMTPHIDMPFLERVREVGPVGEIGVNRRLELRTMLNVPDDTRLVLVSLGGIPTSLPFMHGLSASNIKWITDQDDPERLDSEDQDILRISWSSLGMTFVDVLASCDAVVTKPGYGLFVEAAAAGTPVLYLSRGDWPEEPGLVAWLKRYLPVLALTSADLASGALTSSLETLLAQPRPGPAHLTGAFEAASIIAAML